MILPPQRWERRFLVALIIVASGLRTLFLVEVHDNPFFNNPTSDAYYYDAQAQSIAGGDVVGKGVFFRAPGYPYWLGLIYAVFGHSYLAVRIIQHVLGVISLLLLYFLSRRLFTPVVGAIASLLALFDPVLMYFEGQLLFDWFLTFLCLLWALMFSVAREQKNHRVWFFVSLLFGAICATRPTFLPLALPLFGYQLWDSFKTKGTRSVLRLGIVIASGLAIVILPVTIRNAVVGDDPVLVASQGGINFFIGNNPEADGYTARMPSDIGASWEIAEMTLYVEKQLGHHPSPSEESDFWYVKGLQFILQKPGDFLNLLIRKLYLFWNALEIPNNLDFYTFSRYSILLRVMPIGFWCVGPLGLLGMALAWKAHRGRLIAAFVMMYCAVMVMFFVCDRYRLPVVPFLCIFAAYALAELFQKLKQRGYRWLITSMVPLALLAVLVNSNAYEIQKEEPVHQFYMLGLVDLQHGQYVRAASYFGQASTYGKPIRNLYLHWGECEAALGHAEKAKENFRRELTYHPDSYGALAGMSVIFLGERGLDSAITYAMKAIPVKPFMPSAYVVLGQALYMQHNLARAESVLAAGSSECGAAFRYGNYLLAGVCLERGEIGKAEAEYRSVLRPGSSSQETEYEPSYLLPEEKRIGIDDRTLRAKASYGLGHVFVSRGRLDSAAACFRTSTQLSPGFADAWADLGVALLQSREFPEADSVMHKALSIQPDNFMYWYNYGSLLGSMHRFPEAAEAFKKTLSLRPGFPPALKDLDYVMRAARK